MITLLFRVLVLVVIYAACLRMFSVISGWSRLAKMHGRSALPPDKIYRCRSVRVGPINYGSCMNVSFSHVGLFLKPIFCFSLWHPGILVPWSEMASARTKCSLFGRRVIVDVGNPPLTSIRMSAKLFDRGKMSMAVRN